MALDIPAGVEFCRRRSDDRRKQWSGQTSHQAAACCHKAELTAPAARAVASGATLVAGFIRQSKLSLNGTATVENCIPHNSNATISIIANLNIAGSTNAWTGRLDLTDNDLDVQNIPLATIWNQVSSGYAGGNWNGSGITSTAAASDTTHLTALGVISNSTNGTTPLYGSGTSLGLFDGTSPAATDILVKFTYFGDANLDGKVDGSDYSRIDNGYLTHSTGWYNGDFNYDGVINGSDYTLIDNAFNTQGASLSAAVANPNAAITSQIADASPVPEPATLGTIGIATLSILRRRPARCRHR